MPEVADRRSSGLLLHPTSLPGPFGVGDLGPSAFHWVDCLASMRQSVWQILPLGPTGFGDSPYQSFSAFAGNINLLSPEFLERDGLVSPSLWAGQSFANDAYDSARVVPFKNALLASAADRFRTGQAKHLAGEYDDFCSRESRWLDDYAMFMSIRETRNGDALTAWPSELIRRERSTIDALHETLRIQIDRHKVGQFLFDRQWSALKAYATEKKIAIVGDIPIFVALDSSDVWAFREQFLVDDHCRPSVVAGVPPDYFAEDGQHWGNPIYDWDAMQRTGYSWWTARVKHALKSVDLIRLDHFRGFAQAWHIPAAELTARNGKWVDGPGRHLFDALREHLGGLPFIAEDLGVITPDVDALRIAFDLPGMRVLQFAIGAVTNTYLPHNYEPHTIVYTGTHDNDTTNGWWSTLTEHDRKFFTDYIGKDIVEPSWEMIRLAWSSVARLAIAPLQDMLGVGSEARMNVPGKADGNWKWRFEWSQFPQGVTERLAEMTARYGR